MATLLQAQKKVFKSFFNDLVHSIEDCVLDIGNACLSKGLIYEATHSILTGNEPKNKKATILLKAVEKSFKMRKDGYERFILILEEESDMFKELTEKMTVSVQDTVKCMFLAQCDDDIQRRQPNTASIQQLVR